MLDIQNNNNKQVSQINSIAPYNKEILQRFEDKLTPFREQCKPFEDHVQQFDKAQRRFIRGY